MEALSRHPPAGMEFVHWPQVLHRYIFGRLPQRMNSRADRIQKATVGVMVFDEFVI